MEYVEGGKESFGPKAYCCVMNTRTVTFVLLLFLLCVVLSPVIVADWPTYLGDNQNTAVADDAPGEEAVVGWTYEPAYNLTSSPTVVNDTAYFGTMDGVPTIEGAESAGEAHGGVHAINASTGEPLWNASVPGGVFSSPSYADGTIYFGTLGGTCMRLRLRQGLNAGVETLGSRSTSHRRSQTAVSTSALHVIFRRN